MESSSLSWLILISKVFGQYPAGIFSGHPRTRILHAIWTTLVLVFHVVFIQTLFAAQYTLRATLEPEHNFVLNLGSFLVLVRFAMSALIYATWLYSTCKFRRAFDTMSAVKIGFSRKPLSVTASLWSKCQNVCWVLIWAAYAVVNLIVGGTVIRGPSTNYCKDYRPEYFAGLKNRSWIAMYLDLSHESLPKLATGTMPHIFGLFLGEILAINFVVLFAYQIRRRLYELTEDMVTAKASTAEHIYHQTLRVRRAFFAFQAAAGPLIIVQISTFLLMSTILTFVSASFFLSSTVRIIYAFLLPALSVFEILKAWALASCGERLTVQAKAFKFAVLNASIGGSGIKYGAGHESLGRLQKIVDSDDMKFQLTGNGYFELNKKMLTSALAAIVSYNVVIVQFQLAN